jgi:hypothetical protein
MDRRLVPPLVILIVGSIALTLAAGFSGIFSFDLETARLLQAFHLFPSSTPGLRSAAGASP